MADYILELAKNPLARSIIGKLPLPVSLPPVLARAEGPWSEAEFSGKTVLAAAASRPEHTDGRFEAAIIDTMQCLGGRIIHHVTGDDRCDGLLLDATGIRSPLGLEALFIAAQKGLKHLHRPSRIVITARSPAAAGGDSTETQATAAALSAFVKSLAREVGGHGTTANAVFFPAGAARGAAEVAAWFLSNRSTFISGQTIDLTSPAPDTASGSAVPASGLLAGKTAVVTGAARGIGLAICKAMRREGAKVLGIDHPSQQDALREAMQEIGADADSQDLSDALAADRVAQIIKTFGQAGQVDCVIHNAGITRDRTLKRMSPSEWDSVMRVNYQFPLTMAQAMFQADGTSGRLV